MKNNTEYPEWKKAPPMTKKEAIKWTLKHILLPLSVIIIIILFMSIGIWTTIKWLWLG